MKRGFLIRAEAKKAASKPRTWKAQNADRIVDSCWFPLQIKSPELIAMTFSHLIACVEDEEYRCRYLLNVALTYKDFLNIGLDTLWEELYSFKLMPLLKLLPALQIERPHIRTWKCPCFIWPLPCFQILSGNVSQADCDRLQYYSRKVKSFDNMDHNLEVQVHPSNCSTSSVNLSLSIVSPFFPERWGHNPYLPFPIAVPWIAWTLQYQWLQKYYCWAIFGFLSLSDGPQNCPS